MQYKQVNIKIDERLYPELAEKMLKLRKERKLQKAFREFLQEMIIKEKAEQGDLFQ